MVVYPLLILQPLLSVHNPVRLKFLYLVGIDAKSLIVINYSGHVTKMALESKLDNLDVCIGYCSYRWDSIYSKYFN